MHIDPDSGCVRRQVSFLSAQVISQHFTAWQNRCHGSTAIVKTTLDLTRT